MTADCDRTTEPAGIGRLSRGSGLPRAAAAGGCLHAARAAGPDAAGDGARARGLPAAGGRRHAVDATGTTSSASPRDRCGRSSWSARGRAARRSAGRARSRVAHRVAGRARRTKTPCCRRSTRRSTRLEQIDPEQARIVELRYFVGLSIEETAEALDMSPATLKRRWALARAWLFRELSGGAMSALNPEQWRRVRELFERGARSRIPAIRRPRLAGARGWRTIPPFAPKWCRCSITTRAPARFSPTGRRRGSRICSTTRPTPRFANRARSSGPTRSSASSGAAAWAACIWRPTRGSAARSRSRRCRRL